MSEAPAPARVTYIYELADYLALAALVKANPRMKKYNLKWSWPYLAATLLVTILFFTISAKLMNWFHFMSAFSGLVLFIVIFIIVSGSRLSKMQERDTFLLSHDANAVFTREMSETGINSDFPAGRAFCSWQAIAHCVTTPERLFLFLDAHQTLLFPRRAFAAQEDFDAAVTFAKAHLPEGVTHG